MKTRIHIALVSCLGAAATAAGQVNVQLQSNGLRYTTVLRSGTSADKYDIVFVGDGFTATEQATFNTAVTDAVAALRARAPYDTTMCAFNVWRVNVISAQSGVDHPEDSIFRNTELDCRYGDPPAEAERCITSNSPAKCFEAAAWAPDYDAVFVLVNDTAWGGCAGSLVFSSIAPGFAGIITHELGHKVGALADEYDCYVCDGSDSNRTYTGSEPGEVNLTSNTNRATTKWASLILPATPLPTTVDTPAGVVGLWAGGGYYQFGVFRPQANCHMRNAGSDFCAVCRNQMRTELAGRCTACQLDPGSLLCIFGSLNNKWRYRWDRDLKFRWPIPPCLSCPFDRDLRIRSILVINQLPAGFSLDIMDGSGRSAATTDGPIRDGTAQLEFDARADTQYFAEMTQSSDYQPTGELIDLSIQLFRGQVEQQLPGGL